MIRLLLAAATFLALPAHAAGEIIVRVVPRGDAIEVVAHADLAADIPTAWRVLTEYDRYADFIPDLAVSRTTERNGATAIVEQKGEARFLFFFRYPLEVQLEISESPPHTVLSHAIAGNVRELSGRYDLAPSAWGVRLDYSGRIVLADEPPPFLHLAAVRFNVARQFEALVREIERQAVQ